MKRVHIAFGLFSVVALALTLGVTGCRGDEAQSGPTSEKDPQVLEEPNGLRILFIGNSLTYYNGLPLMLERIFQQGGVEVDEIDAIANPNFGLQDHWPRSAVRDRIRDGDWDYVILQQGPSATEGRPSLLEYTTLFDELIRESGGVTALYMVWPPKSRIFELSAVYESYKMAAEQVDGVFLPAGQSWRVAWEVDPDLNFYGPDDFHPNAFGSYMAALVIYQRLSGQDPRDLPSVIPVPDLTLSIPEETIRIYQNAAYETNRREIEDTD